MKYWAAKKKRTRKDNITIDTSIEMCPPCYRRQQEKYVEPCENGGYSELDISLHWWHKRTRASIYVFDALYYANFLFASSKETVQRGPRPAHLEIRIVGTSRSPRIRVAPCR